LVPTSNDQLIVLSYCHWRIVTWGPSNCLGRNSKLYCQHGQGSY